MNYNINKGIGRTVEFKGLKAQYLFIFAGGLLGTLILVMILYMAGVNSYICLFLGAGGIAANKRHPRYIICRKPVNRYLKFTPKQNAV